jgi:peptidoglycan-associated lipoprotein
MVAAPRPAETAPGAAAAPPGPAAGPAAVAPGARPAQPAPRDFAETPQLQNIYFDFDRYNIRPDAARTLDANVEWMKSNAGTLILIEGHCDERGTNEYNLALGERRARATRDYLIANGVRADRLSIVSYGEERPGCAERNETCWATNRRAHFLTKQR